MLVVGSPHVYRPALLLVEEGIAFNHNVYFFFLALSFSSSRVFASTHIPVIFNIPAAELLSASLSLSPSFSISTLFLLSLSLPMDDNSILAVSSLATPSALLPRYGNLGPSKGRRRTLCEFGPQANPLCIPLP